MTVYLEVTAEGEAPRRMTLDQFLAENEGAANVCRVVQSLPKYQAVSFPGLTVREVDPPAKGPRVAKFKTPINPKYKAEGATVKINRDTGLITVRLLRRHKEHFFTLQDLAELVYTRSVLAERAKKKKERKGVRR